MFSAISLGVFCRAAPSTRAIIRSMKVSPGFVVIWMTTRSESTLVPPVTADRSPPDSRITGADSPVMADSSTLATPSIDVAVAGDDVAGLGDDPVADPELRGCDLLLGAVRAQPAGDGAGACLAQGVGLGLASALGDGFGQVGEDHGEPEPHGDGPREDVRLEHGEHRGDERADLDHEHDRAVPHGARVELAYGLRECTDELGRLEGTSLDPSRGDGGHQRSPSASGPSASAGRKVKPVRMMATPARSSTNCGR